MRTRFLLGNWKLNGSRAANSRLCAALIEALAPREHRLCGVFAPYPYLGQLQALLQPTSLAWGAQDCSRFESGAFTGEVSASMIAEFGSAFCLVGHSERRQLFGESDEAVAQKVGRVVAAGMRPVVCVGETLAERDAGMTESVVGRQLDAVLAAHPAERLTSMLLAYEPVWAIGSGRSATPELAQAVHGFLRERLAHIDRGWASNLAILYGGSVKAANAAGLFAMPDIDGGLVGGASLDVTEFSGIWAAL